nr:MAG TPA: hypothetical protein [Caudoviricetes sp.]
MVNLFGSTRKWDGRKMNDRILLTFTRLVLVVTCGVMAIGLLRVGLLSVSLGVRL